MLHIATMLYNIMFCNESKVQNAKNVGLQLQSPLTTLCDTVRSKKIEAERASTDLDTLTIRAITQT